MNFKHIWGGRKGEVIVEYDGLLPDEVFEAIRHHGGIIETFGPLTISSDSAAELGAALAGVLARAEVPVTAIRLRRSQGELVGRPIAVA